jgi:MFS family permease
MSRSAEAAAATGATPPVPLRRNRGFRLLWIAQVVSDTGTEASLIAYPLLILALTHSPVIAGLVGTVRMVVQLILGLPGEALSDRLDRRLTMIVCDSGRAVVLALLAALVLVHLVSWPVVLAIAVIDGGANVLFNPSASAALPAIVADEQLEQAWATTQGRTYAAGLAGPALGGFLFGLGRAVPFAGDAASYLVSAAAVSRIRGKFRAESSGGRTALWREAVDGLHLVWRIPLLRIVVFQAPLLNFAFNGVIFTITLALRQHGTAAGTIGLAQAGIAVGGVFGALIAPRLQGRLPLRRLIIVIAMVGTAMFGAAALVVPSTLVALPVAATVLLAPTASAALFAAMQRATPRDMLGRVSSSVYQASMGLAVLAPLTSGLLVEHFSGQWAMAAFAAAEGISLIISVALPGLRDTASVAASERTDQEPPLG